MDWTTEAPSASGIYWVAEPGEKVYCVSFMTLYGTTFVTYHGNECDRELDKFTEGTQWLGPIVVPEAPKKD